MKKLITLLGLAAFAFAGQAVAAEKGFKSIFDGKSLKGWNGDPKFWSVQDGAISGKTTKENPTKGNTFIIWDCLLYTSPSPRDGLLSRMPSSA